MEVKTDRQFVRHKLIPLLLLISASLFSYDTYTSFEPTYETYVLRCIPIVLSFLSSYSIYTQKPYNKWLYVSLYAIYLVFFIYLAHTYFYTENSILDHIPFLLMIFTCFNGIEQPNNKAYANGKSAQLQKMSEAKKNVNKKREEQPIMDLSQLLGNQQEQQPSNYMQ